MGIELPRIEVSARHKKLLAKQNKCTPQSVRNALRYMSDSDEARAIRKSAITLLEKEAKNISIKVSE